MLLVAALAIRSEAQFSLLPTPPASITAASAEWRLKGEPIPYSGSLYYPTGPTVYFDGKVMAQVSEYQGVPVYEDSTLSPLSLIYVPVGGNLMRPYERRRSGELAGTTGSRVPSWPVQVKTAELPPPPEPVGDLLAIEVLPPTTPTPPAESAWPSTLRSARLPLSDQGVWIEFEGVRWYNDGKAVHYDAAQFESVGDYHGFPVYRRRGSDPYRIFVAVMPDGPLAPFVRR